MKKILLYGYGNPGRMDDGLGNVFINEITAWINDKGIENIQVDSNYQLNIEDAEAISIQDIVIFIDASQENIEDFVITKVNPSDAKIEFSMHAVSTAYILSLCEKIYKKSPETYLIHIKGYEWDFAEILTEKAAANLNKALNFLKEKLLVPDKLEHLLNESL